MRKTKLLLYVLVGLLLACDDEDLNPIEKFSDPNYPTKYCVLSEAERNELYENFNSDMKIYFEVDYFGHFDRKNGQKLNSEIFSGKINSKDSVLQKVKTFIHNNEQLYGIKNTSLLTVNEIKGYWVSYGGSLVQDTEADRNRWFVKYENQIYNNVEVYNTAIGFYISPKGVYQSFGHWYPEIHLPKYEDISLEDAKNHLVGKTLSYADWTGGKEYIVSNDDFYPDDIPEKMIVPYRKDDCIEMRLCWKIASKTIWNFYVDVMSGELILNEQTVYF